VRSNDGKGSSPARSTSKVAAPPSAISEGQLQELGRLAVKLEIDLAQLEERLGKKLSDLTRPEAKEWIKRVRAMAEEIAPGKRAYGQWPGGQVDLEAQYLTSQKEANAHFAFKLFNGEEVSGNITDFTPYTITIVADSSGDDLVLRKLAIAYYKRTPVPTTASEAPATPAKRTRQPKAKAESVTIAPPVTPTDTPPNLPTPVGVDSDRVGEPVTPERDNMDEDRGV
jgi:sRNA-binding regulator protein Hfq